MGNAISRYSYVNAFNYGELSRMYKKKKLKASIIPVRIKYEGGSGSSVIGVMLR